MSSRGVAYIVAGVVLVVLFVANWNLFVTPVAVNLLFAQIQIPLIALVLFVAGVVALVGFVVHALRMREWARERRTLRKDLEAERVRAEHEEQSRINTLRVTMERELGALRAQLDRVLDGQAALLGREPNGHSLAPRAPATDAAQDPSRPIEPELIPPRTAHR
ncbi:MAG TPA: LapA family protein [Steroidobacteraceae bacterium]|nr:LapA family protein [Steroidobacteraceae bacterium]